MSNNLVRLGTANMYDNALRNLSARQTNLSNLQENLTSGKRVVRASDDPVSAAQAERALNRMSRIQADQRALETQRNAITQGESSLGDAVDLLHNFRELIRTLATPTLSPTTASPLPISCRGFASNCRRSPIARMPMASRCSCSLGSALAPFMWARKAPRRTTLFKACPGKPPARVSPCRARWTEIRPSCLTPARWGVHRRSQHDTNRSAAHHHTHHARRSQSHHRRQLQHHVQRGGPRSNDRHELTPRTRSPIQPREPSPHRWWCQISHPTNP